jgi:hypothetical protein
VQIFSNAGFAALGLASILIAAIAARYSRRLLAWAGLVYFGIGLVEWALGEYRARAARKLSTAETARA